MRILVIAPPNRPDFYHYLEQDDKATYFLLWNEKQNDTSAPIPKLFKEEFYWENYTTPKKLITSIQPDKIIFFEIIDQRQIALLVVANYLRITTFYLEHGAAGDKESALKRSKTDRDFIKARLHYLIHRAFTNSKSIFKSKIFYFAAVGYVKSISTLTKFIWLPVQMLISKPNKALQLLAFQERIPAYALTFNEQNFEEYALYAHAHHERAILTGIPGFDSFASPQTAELSNEIVYIEHPYLEEGLCNWDKEHHKKIAMKLFEFGEKNRFPILIKLHPRSNKSLWDTYKLESEYFKIAQHEDVTHHLLHAKLILSYSSSLLTGLLCAKKNIVQLGWHPTPQIFGSDFSKTGLCHVSLKIQDLNSQIGYWSTTNLTENNQELFDTFIHKFNFPFDGKASQRIIKIIHTL